MEQKIKIQRHSVNSSTIEEIGYDHGSRTLEIKFYSTGVYRYTPITQECYNELDKAESVGSYFAKHIRNNQNVKYEKLG